jgi:hypothetical protein
VFGSALPREDTIADEAALDRVEGLYAGPNAKRAEGSVTRLGDGSRTFRSFEILVSFAAALLTILCSAHQNRYLRSRAESTYDPKNGQ